jgi:N-methylhydantoinase B
MNIQEKNKSIVDAITVEIIRNGLIAVTEDMKTNLMRTAYNMIIYEALDFTVGLFTPKGETVSIGLGLPMFIRGMASTVTAKIEKYGLDGIKPGDILVTNDAYITGSHLNHFTFTIPVFHEGEIAAFACCMAHWLDVGGSIGQITTDIYSEGLQIPIVKYQREGVVNEELVDIIGINVRMPERALGDLRAQITAIKTGERGFSELLKRYGRDAVDGAIVSIMDQTEAQARANTLSIPDGIYEAESFMDDDGVDVGVRIPIKVRVEVSGDRMKVDLTDVGAQVRGFYNSGITTGVACAQVAYKCLTTPTEYPVNDGSFRSLDVVVPSGRVISAERPFPMRVWMTFPMTVIDTIFKAIAPAIPDRTIAGHHADLLMTYFHGLSPKDGRFFIAGIGPLGGGWGAKRDEDGVAATVCINDGDTHNSPIEQLESKYPFLIEYFRLRNDSGGAGRQRGGMGVEICMEAVSPMSITSRVDRMHCQPWGLEGGEEAMGNAVRIRRGDEWDCEPPNAKILGDRLRRGDAFLAQSGGGGGFGDPLERDIELVANDVRQEYVSREVAHDSYGVVLGPDDKADHQKTKQQRDAIRAQRQKMGGAVSAAE